VKPPEVPTLDELVEGTKDLLAACEKKIATIDSADTTMTAIITRESASNGSKTTLASPQNREETIAPRKERVVHGDNENEEDEDDEQNNDIGSNVKTKESREGGAGEINEEDEEEGDEYGMREALDGQDSGCWDRVDTVLRSLSIQSESESGPMSSSSLTSEEQPPLDDTSLDSLIHSLDRLCG
jgi:hypothetical protein